MQWTKHVDMTVETIFLKISYYFMYTMARY